MTDEFTIEQIRAFVGRNFNSVSARYVKSALQHYDELAAQQKSEIKKPDVDLTFWETWLTTHGYSIEFDADGLWAESWIQEHKWVDIFDLMLQFAIEQNIKMPTEEEIEEAAYSYACCAPIVGQSRMGFRAGIEWLRNQIEKR